MNDTLKECPFCGNDGSGSVEEALHVTFSEHDWRDPSWSVQCDRCTATMGYFDTEAEAIAVWNARKSPRTDSPIMLQMAAADDAAQMWERRWNALVRMYPRERPCFVDRDGDWSLRDFIDYAGEVCGFRTGEATDV